jgi:hypothetical protein
MQPEESTRVLTGLKLVLDFSVPAQWRFLEFLIIRFLQKPLAINPH